MILKQYDFQIVTDESFRGTKNVMILKQFSIYITQI